MPDTSAKNRKHSQTGFHDETGSWYKLDNAAVIMPAVSDSTVSSLFRLSVTLKERVNHETVVQALERVCPRFPYFLVELRRGFFWNYFQPLDQMPMPEADSRHPNINFDIKKHGQLMFRIRLHDRTIACEFSHVLSDGTGVMIFLKTLLIDYFRHKGLDPGICPDGILLDEKPDPEEYEDAFQRHFQNNYPHPEHRFRAFHQSSPLLGQGRYRITTGIIPVADALEKARKYGATITELFIAAFLDAFQMIRASYPYALRKRSRPIATLEVPVNMRKFYPSKTLRNFTLLALVSLDMRLGHYPFDKLVSIVHHRMAIESDELEMAKHIARNAGGLRSPLIRVTPLVIKDILLRILYSVLGEDLISGFLSNLGTFDFPKSLSEHIESLRFIGAPSRITQSNASMLSWNGNIYISFGSLVTSRELERHFFSRLTSIGIPVRLECNMEYDE